MATANNVAKYYLMLAAGSEEDAGEAMTHLKLQKLLYYAQGFCLALTGKGMFVDSVEAWKQGPVVSSVYREYRDYGSSAIPADSNFDPAASLKPEECDLLTDVWNAYGQFSAWKLRNMTHEEPPWLKAYKEGANATISEDSMREYFLTQIN